MVGWGQYVQGVNKRLKELDGFPFTYSIIILAKKNFLEK